MTDNFYLALAAILIFPLIPAFFIYKYLPVGKGDDVDVSGPFSGLSLKLKGAFAAYFLLSSESSHSRFLSCIAIFEVPRM